MSEPLSRKFAAALPYILPVVGGFAGVSCINLMKQGNPMIGIVLGALAGWVIAIALVRMLDR